MVDFTVLKKISEGTCAEVFLVQLDPLSPRAAGAENGIAALKLARPGYEPTMLVEAVELWGITAKGAHPHIVSLIACYEDSGVPQGLLLEYCCGGSLGELLRASSRATTRRPTAPEDSGVPTGIPLQAARRLFAQLVDALLFLESMQLWHRDIKPDNVLLTSSNVEEAALKLSDFGFARRTPYSTQRLDRGRGSKKVGEGSLAFMSPERLRQFIGSTAADTKSFQTDDEDYDKHNGDLKTGISWYDRSKAEVWSAGLVLYEMVYGGFALGSVRTIPELVAAQKSVQDVLHRGRCRCTLNESPALHDLLCWMLEPNPSRRAGLRDVANHSWLRGLQKISLSLPCGEETVDQIPLSSSPLSPVLRASECSVAWDVLPVFRTDTVVDVDVAAVATESPYADSSGVAFTKTMCSSRESSVNSWSIIGSQDSFLVKTTSSDDDEMTIATVRGFGYPGADCLKFLRPLQAITAWIPPFLRSLFHL